MFELNTAINHYNGLVLDGALGADSWAALQPGLRQRNLYFGDRPLCSVLRPLLHSRRSWDYLRRRTALMLGVFRKSSDAMLADAALRAQVYLTPQEEELLHAPTGYDTTIPTARLDSFMAHHPDGRLNLSFIEFNGESPAGMAYGDELAELFLTLPVMQRFAEHYHLEPVLARHNALEALLDIYHQWRGVRSQLPRIAIVDWAGVPTTSEFHLFADYFGRHNIPTTICTPDDLDYAGGRMTAQGAPVDFIYKRVLISEFLAKYGLDHPLVRAVRDGAVCMANPFSCKLLHKKASFAFVSDERNAHLFTPEEQEAVRRHIPWTRVIEERYTQDRHGHHIDLLPWAAAHREHLVLKPNDEYGGAGVLIGWETTQDVWDAALRNALHEPSIVQERVEIAYESFPYVHPSGEIEIATRLVDCDPFLFHGTAVGGCLVRLSAVTLLNVTAGGGSTAPAFIVDSK